jgi:hypothetical protein
MTKQVNSVDVGWVGLPVPGGRMLRRDNVLAAPAARDRALPTAISTCWVIIHSQTALTE